MRFCCTALAVLLATSSLPAAEDPLDALPANAGVVLRLSPPADVSGKVKSFLNKAAPRYAPIADSIGIGLGSLIGNPTLVGIDANRAWYVAVVPRAEKRPAILFAIPTSNAKDLKQAVGAGYTFADHEDWVLYSLDAETVDGLSPDAAGATSIRPQIVEPFRDVFSEGEAAVYLNIPVLREAYRPQIERAKGEFIKATDPTNAATEAAAEPPIAGNAARTANRKILETLLAAIDDMTGVAMNLAIGDAALEAGAVIAVESDSGSAQFLTKQSPGDFPLLEKLPRGRPVYYALAGDFGDVITASIGLSVDAYSGNEKLRAQVEELGRLRFEEIAGSLSLGELEGGVLRGINLVRIDRPERCLELVREMAKSTNAGETPGPGHSLTIQPEAETVGSVKVDVLTVDMAPVPRNDPNKSSQKFLNVLFGNDDLTQRLAVVDGLFVKTLGGEQNIMETAIGAIRGEAPGDEPAQKAAAAARARLGQPANLLTLVDLPRLLGGAVQIAIESGELPLPVEKGAVESLNLAPSYSGLTVAAGDDQVRIRGVMPAEQVRGIVDLFDVLQKAAPKRRQAN